MTTIEISLPDGLAKEANEAGLLTSEAIEKLVREAIRRRALGELKEAMERMAAVDGPVMTPEEIEEEIQAARTERRAREARAAGT
jgi:metal-responsive CopG/Arc/MetJ family transcriptional regulator